MVLAAFGLWMAVLTVVYYLAPLSWRLGVWTALSVSGAAAVLVGIQLNRPRLTGAWLWFFAGLVFYAASDLSFNLTLPGGPARPPLTLSDDILLLIGVVLIAVALFKFTRAAEPRPDRPALIDAFVLVLGTGLLAWVLTVEARFAQPHVGVITGVLLIAYPVFDIIVLGMVARLVTAVRLSPAVILLALGIVGYVVADALFRIGRIDDQWLVRTPLDLGYIALYALWGAAALVPSMRGIGERRLARPREATVLRLVILGISALIPPAILLYETIGLGTVRHGVVIAISSLVMFLLVIARLVNLANRLREQIGRERGLRTVTTALVSAADDEGIADALDDGIRDVLEPGTTYHFLLMTQGADAKAMGRHLGALPKSSIEAVRRLGEPTLLESGELPRSIAAALGAHRPDGHGAGSDKLTLALPLTVGESGKEDTTVGVMLVAADERPLSAAQDRLAVLASQAALAIDRVTLSEQLRKRTSEEYFRALVHNAADVILIIDSEDRIAYASPSARAMFGEVDLVGTMLLDHGDPAERERAERVFRRIQDRPVGSVEPDNWGTTDWTLRRPDGTAAQVEISVRDLRADPTVRGLVFTLRDVTDKRRLERELTHRANHDALTGLANRTLFAERMQKAVEAHRGVVGVLFIDLDDFKVVNDTLGHASGDQVLKAVGWRISSALRPHDTAARLGGDEFAVLIDDAGEPGDVEDAADRIIRALRQPYSIGGDLISCSASIGIGTTADASDGSELLRQADLALYVAKGAGKSQWRRYQPELHTTIVERLELRAELDRAIHDGGLLLEYQPIVRLDDGHAVGFEALLRWNHPTRGRLTPDAFIDVAEESGLIVPIGEWVLRTAIAAAATWRKGQAYGAPYVAVNVSARQFRTPGFVRLVKRELAASKLPPSCLMLEITESLLLRDDDQVWDDLAEVRRLGVRVAIDDFGTGYSSLSYLRHVPLDVLKIDRLFTGTVTTSTQQRALVDGIVRLAHTLGLEVVAEGIETTDERELLRRIGCPYGQGFLFSRPMPLPDALRWLRRTELAA
ncbi:PAS domain S-box-containing protein/diguanylate cyclase (GGDEF) domain-containing protein [Asanoa hainanensis]|uniref:PAS domain S-box-containing protein/diguanylate cyclase (GGDEF) domain-containing protein n=1 Tax=Asanoa hainanensis TaxID=560556 RepID=A0A239K6W9_9ACTN|nr:EAL domain-containing protein [Asanoa hainanensis]SNT13432.1 PAS domain S-box-containing protein/diguanylate cyclase (GGDEF) domain-containing protein [Asanoa hainanensis]